MRAFRLIVLAALLTATGVSAGCGRKGDPIPPSPPAAEEDEEAKAAD